MEGGPPGFGRDYTCPNLLRNRPSGFWLSPTGLSPSVARLSCSLRLAATLHVGRPTTPHTPKDERFGLFPVRSPLLRESRLISLPQATEMFHFAWFASHAYEFSIRCQCISLAGFPIRKSPDQSLFAAPRGLSQLTTSFIAFRRQGIHRALLIA